MLSDMREDVKPPETSVVMLLGDFINMNLHKALIVNNEVNSNSAMIPLPQLEPKGELLIRYEPDTKDLYITASSFKTYCVGKQVNYKETLAELSGRGVFVEALNKRMSKGMKLVTPPTRALKFNTTNFDLLNVSNHVPKIENEDRSSDV
jgi:hypothetical protein